MKSAFYISIIFLSFYSVAQVTTSTQAKFEKAKLLMDDSLFYKANEVFIDLLTPDEILPDEVSFYFGKNLFLTGYKDQSRAFLYQYIALRDTSDKFFEETIELLKTLGEDMSYYDPVVLEDTTGTTESSEIVKKHNKGENKGCHPDEVFRCPICNGTEVIVRSGKFGSTFFTCPHCDENGIMDCETYKLYLSGELDNR